NGDGTLAIVPALPSCASGESPIYSTSWGCASLVNTAGAYINPGWITSLVWSKLTSVPTQAAGWLTDAVVTSGSYTNPPWLVSLPFNKVTSTPTTLAGYGIADALGTSGGTVSGPIAFPNGSVTAPAVTFSTEVTTGLYHTTGALKVAVAGVDVARFNTVDLVVNQLSFDLANHDVSFARSATGVILASRDSTHGVTWDFTGDSVMFVKTRAGADAATVRSAAFNGGDGSAANPVFRFNNDSSTGVYRINSNNSVGLTAGGLATMVAGISGGNAIWRDGQNSDRFIFWGSGNPEGVVTAGVGALFLRRDGGAGSTFCVKESGSGNTGWACK
ncbi:MAG TPA: hypothetical protein VHD90_06995, partial [Phototrophicaceae bacterium]|nr:hypothetical protein [Phototrophicaceae bacterium]